MTETIIPGTYIDVRAEGLISAGRIATGVLGIVGTASNGPVGQPVTLALPSQARTQFGLADDPRNPTDGANPLTLVRAVELAYANGASTVVAVRVAGTGKASASYALRNDSGQQIAALSTRVPGSWGNAVEVSVQDSEEDCLIERENVESPFNGVRYAPVVPSPRTRVRVVRGATGQAEGFDVVYRRLQSEEQVRPNAAGRFFLDATPVEAGVPAARISVRKPGGVLVDYTGDAIVYETGVPAAGTVRIDPASGEVTFAAEEVPAAGAQVTATYGVDHALPTPGQVLLTTWSGDLDFADGEAPVQGDTVEVTYLLDRDSCVQVTLTNAGTVERFVGPDADFLSARVNAASQLVSAEPDDLLGNQRPVNDEGLMGTGSNAHGADGANAGRDDYAAGLAALENQLVNIVVLAGQHATTHGDVLAGHLALTANSEHERIGVIGAAGSSVEDINAHGMADGRVVVVAPGIRYPDGITLTSGHTAAAVAGLVASVSPQTSLTNKPLNIPDVDQDFNRGQQAQLIGGNVLTIVRKGGFRVLRGVTSEGEGMPYSAIPTRRIVDYARYGVRSAADPYIGRLNNVRVRDALKSSLDGFLTRMVDEEALTGYELDVFADRSQEIRGEVSVVMTLQPTFSIEFVLVTMFLR
ncbi:phage tail sheath subtilisin-like domain-containing protein [Actinopolymorpha pittospori]